MTEQEADERIGRLLHNRQLSMTKGAREARQKAYEEGRGWANKSIVDNVQDLAWQTYPDDKSLQYEYVLGVAQALNNLARDIGQVDHRDLNQPEGKKR